LLPEGFRDATREDESQPLREPPWLPGT